MTLHTVQLASDFRLTGMFTPTLGWYVTILGGLVLVAVAINSIAARSPRVPSLTLQ